MIALHLDNGFMRKNESSLVEDSLGYLGLHLKVVDASEDFYNATTFIDKKETMVLKETVSPEEKRKIIGDTFMKVAEKEIATMNLNPDNVCYILKTTITITIAIIITIAISITIAITNTITKIITITATMNITITITINITMCINITLFISWF